MFQIAQNVGDLQSGFITTYSSATSIACSGVAQSTDDTFNNGLMRVMGGTTYATISDYTGSTRTFTLASPGLTTATGKVVQWIGFNAQKRSALFEAVNAAIRDTWDGTFYRETRDTRATASITLASGTTRYSLPSNVGKLIQVGIQYTTITGVNWFDPGGMYQVYGEEGAYTIEFLPGFSGQTVRAWTQNVHFTNRTTYQTFADAYTSQPLLLRYYEREPEVDAEDDTTRLPLNYLGWAGADYYGQWLLANGTDADRAVLNVSLPQIQAQAARAKSQLSITKPKPRQSVELDF